MFLSDQLVHFFTELYRIELRLYLQRRHLHHLIEAVSHLLHGALVDIEEFQRLRIEHEDRVHGPIEGRFEAVRLRSQPKGWFGAPHQQRDQSNRYQHRGNGDQQCGGTQRCNRSEDVVRIGRDQLSSNTEGAPFRKNHIEHRHNAARHDDSQKS